MAGPDTPRVLLRAHEVSACRGSTPVLNAVSCAFRAGEITAIAGPNGAGKTSLLNVLSGRLRPRGGHVWLEGRDITGWSVARRARAGIAQLLSVGALFPGLTARDHLRFGLDMQRNAGTRRHSGRDAASDLTRAVELLLQRVRMIGHVDLPVSLLSPGDRLRVQIAMLLAQDPVALLFDEPTARLSRDEARDILSVIAGLSGEAGRTIVIAEHRVETVAAFADRVAVLQNGTLIAEGRPVDMVGAPAVRDVYAGHAAHV